MRRAFRAVSYKSKGAEDSNNHIAPSATRPIASRRRETVRIVLNFTHLLWRAPGTAGSRFGKTLLEPRTHTDETRMTIDNDANRECRRRSRTQRWCPMTCRPSPFALAAA